MTPPIPITIPFANVNDESAVLVEWLIEDGAPVEAGALVATIETSKAAVDIESTASGFLRHAASVGQDVPVGSPLCYITEKSNTPLPMNKSGKTLPGATAGEVMSPMEPASNGTVEYSGGSRPARFTPLARKIADAHGLSSQFVGHERITSSDVLSSLAVQPENGSQDLTDKPQQMPPDLWETTRVSARARALLEKHQLSVEHFAGRGMVREQDVLELLSPSVPESAGSSSGHLPPSVPQGRSDVAATSAQPLNSTTSVRHEPVPTRKRTEIRNLAAGLANTLPNTIIVACPTQGLRAAVSQASAIQGSASAVIIYETARLLRKYAFFNGYYRDNQTYYYEHVNIGFAVDAGKGLKVPVIHNADGKSMTQIAQEMQDLVADYLNDTLSVESLSGATFTISDLSGEGVFAFTPLISNGQAAIMGIGGEFFAPGSRNGLFNLILTFDHQVAEGRQAALFLADLKSRLGAYEAALEVVAGVRAAVVPSEPSQHAEICCARCLGTPEYLQRMSAYLIPTIDANGATRLLCTVCLQGC